MFSLLIRLQECYNRFQSGLLLEYRFELQQVEVDKMTDPDLNDGTK